MATIKEKLAILLADTYTLYLKTQNYHWHVKGLQFKNLHELFENQYQELANAVDEIAERIVINGDKAPATFEEFNRLKTIKEGNSCLSAEEMVKELASDRKIIVKDLNQALKLAQADGEEGIATVLSNLIAMHEKTLWMLSASQPIY